MSGAYLQAACGQSMPQRQAGKLQYTCPDSTVLQRLEGVNGKHEVGDLLMLPQLPASFESDDTIEEAWKSIFPLAEPIPSWHILSELLIHHKDDRHDMLVGSCLFVEVWPEVVLQILGDFQQHGAFQLGSCVLLAIEL